MVTANSHLRTIKISPDDPQSKAALEVEQRLLDHYGLQGRTDYVELKQTPIRVRVLEVGSGRPIVVMLGGAGEGYPFFALAAQLKDWKWIIINRPGAGLSDFVDHRQVDLRQLAIDTFGSVMDASGLDSAPFVCNSMGGSWGFWFALAQPRRVAQMVQLGCPALMFNTSPPFMIRLMSIPMLNRQLVNFMVPKNPGVALEFMKIMGSSEEVIKAQPPLANEAAYIFAQVPTYRDAWYTLLEAVYTLVGTKARYQFGEESLARIETPVLLIWGNNDPVVHLNVAHKVAKIIPKARLCEVSSGHLPYMDQPETCARLIQEFLD